MLIRLNEGVKETAPYDPPFFVERRVGRIAGDEYRSVDRSLPDDDQIAELLWVPALLVSRFLYQFPFLVNEADEMFSIGVQVVVDKVKNSDVSGDVIGSHVYEKGRAVIEDFANSLDVIVASSTRTKYTELKKGKPLPKHVKLAPTQHVEDELTDLYFRDAVETLGYDPENLTLSQRRKVARLLGFTEDQIILKRKKS
jgi:hypothetical protein